MKKLKKKGAEKVLKEGDGPPEGEEVVGSH